jgi:hypothetical protein
MTHATRSQPPQSPANSATNFARMMAWSPPSPTSDRGRDRRCAPGSERASVVRFLFRLADLLMFDRKRSIVGCHLSVVLPGNWIARTLGALVEHAGTFKKGLGISHLTPRWGLTGCVTVCDRMIDSVGREGTRQCSVRGRRQLLLDDTETCQDLIRRWANRSWPLPPGGDRRPSWG